MPRSTPAIKSVRNRNDFVQLKLQVLVERALAMADRVGVVDAASAPIVQPRLLNEYRANTFRVPNHSSQSALSLYA